MGLSVGYLLVKKRHMNTKKEASTHFQSKEITQSKTRFWNMKRATFSSPKTLLSTKSVSKNETSYPLEPMAVHDRKPIS